MTIMFRNKTFFGNFCPQRRPTASLLKHQECLFLLNPPAPFLSSPPGSADVGMSQISASLLIPPPPPKRSRPAPAPEPTLRSLSFSLDPAAPIALSLARALSCAASPPSRKLSPPLRVFLPSRSLSLSGFPKARLFQGWSILHANLEEVGFAELSDRRSCLEYGRYGDEWIDRG